MAKKKNLSYVLHEDWLIGISCNNNVGTPLDGTDGSVQFKMSTANLGEVTLNLESPIGITILEENPMRAQIRVTPDMQRTAGVAPGNYNYEIRAILADGVISDQAAGILTVDPSLYS